jgi:hypothetical protein
MARFSPQYHHFLSPFIPLSILKRGKSSFKGADAPSSYLARITRVFYTHHYIFLTPFVPLSILKRGKSSFEGADTPSSYLTRTTGVFFRILI